MIERHIDVETSEGLMTTFTCCPERDGPHPVIIFYMDSYGIREELRDMARRLASTGYYVALPNLYYRSGIAEPGPIPYWDGKGDPPQHPVLAAIAALNIPKVMDDTDALIRFLGNDPAAMADRIGCVGYCMSGRFAINAAGRHPERVAAAISMYGTELITESPDSPHLAARHATAEIYIGCAEHDHWAPLPKMEELRLDLEKHGANAELEIYPCTEHGFAFPERQSFNKLGAERHWERMFALFDRQLR